VLCFNIQKPVKKIILILTFLTTSGTLCASINPVTERLQWDQYIREGFTKALEHKWAASIEKKLEQSKEWENCSTHVGGINYENQTAISFVADIFKLFQPQAPYYYGSMAFSAAFEYVCAPNVHVHIVMPLNIACDFLYFEDNNLFKVDNCIASPPKGDDILLDGVVFHDFL
jgi:hypothetical protein